MSVNVSLVSLPGNAVDVRPYVYDYNEGVQNFTRADYGKQFDILIKTRGEGVAFQQTSKALGAANMVLMPASHPTAGLNVTIPGDLLRFDILINVSSNVNPLAANVLALKVLRQFFKSAAAILVMSVHDRFMQHLA